MSKDRPPDRLSRYGLIATGLYFVVLTGGIAIAESWSLVEFGTLRLNELGDLLAGAFGPLALFWLVLGFFQQGKELRNSIATLKLQAEELANSVRQQEELVGVTRESLQHEQEMMGLSLKQRKESLQPNLVVDFRATAGRGNIHKYKLAITNTGGSVSRFRAELIAANDDKIIVHTLHFETGDTIEQSTTDYLENYFSDCQIDVTFIDRENDQFTQKYVLRHAADTSWPSFEAVRIH
ncbi:MULTISPECIES: hypothetical protein [unclassified Sulfitobacter]|uniref:hypothetical protein n=1 Tax=unclassified Sulfitobacter TaxID=196795 RepID=UPI00374692A2